MFFLGGGNASEDGVVTNELVIVVGFLRREFETAKVFYSDFFCDSGNSIKIVARNNPRSDIIVIEILDDFFRSGTDFVFKEHIA